MLQNTLLTTDELADYLRCSKRHVFAMKRRHLPCIKIGRALRWDRATVVEHLRDHNDR